MVLMWIVWMAVGGISTFLLVVDQMHPFTTSGTKFEISRSAVSTIVGLVFGGVITFLVYRWVSSHDVDLRFLSASDTSDTDATDDTNSGE